MTTVLQLSDTHFTASGLSAYDLDPVARLTLVLDAWRQRGETADLILLTGDLTDDGSPAGCRALAEMVGALGVPMFAIPGNHDDPAAVAAAFGSDQEVELSGWRVVGVSSIIPGEVQGLVSAEELNRRLDGLDDRPTIVAVHHPPSSPSEHRWFRLDNGDDLVRGLSQRHHVRGVLSGHLHQPFDHAAGDLALLGGPSTLYALRHSGNEWEKDPTVPTGARILTLADDGGLSSELLVA